ncbi:MAG: tetratricopeptide repeat protein [FCB group bacterium]|nr:tetratricopeptide repeat protein [FCB group bacterium]
MNSRRLNPVIPFLLIFIFMASVVSGSSRPLRTIWVKVVADQHFGRQNSWEKKANQQLDKVSELLAEHLGVRLEIISYEKWYHENEKDMKRLAAQMIEEVELDQADILIGFTLRSGSKKMKSLRNDGVTLAYQGMLLKMYQGAPDHNAFLPIIILHEMVHMFGGVHIESGSLMSTQMEGDIKLKLDPLNRRILDLTREIDFKKGYSSLRADDIVRLAHLYERAISTGNNEIPTYLELGSMYMTLGQFEQAIEPFQQVIEINQSMEYAWLSWGDCYYKLDDSETAIDIFNKALNSVEEKGQFYHRLSVLHYNRGEYNKSYQCALDADRHGFPVKSDLWARLQEIKKTSGL